MTQKHSLTIQAVSIIGGILTAIFFLGFLALARILRSDISCLIVGSILILTTLTISRIVIRSFLDAMNITLYIAGCVLIGFGINASINILFTTLMGISILTFLLSRGFILPFLQVGDKVVSRLSIRVDRPMDFVQLKDQRGACFEPIGSISGYRWNNGLGYYVDIKDASANFFFDHLGKGVYVLEYSYRVSRAGTYETGLATMQCAYAPEYASHSASMTIIIK